MSIGKFSAGRERWEEGLYGIFHHERCHTRLEEVHWEVDRGELLALAYGAFRKDSPFRLWPVSGKVVFHLTRAGCLQVEQVEQRFHAVEGQVEDPQGVAA